MKRRCVACALACGLMAAGCSTSPSQSAPAPATAMAVDGAGLAAADSLGRSLYQSDAAAARMNARARELASHPDSAGH